MNTMKIGDRDYNVIGQVKVKDSDQTVPLVDIPMMSDADWNEGAGENAVKNYLREFGMDPDSIDQAVSWQRQRVEELTGGMGNE